MTLQRKTSMKRKPMKRTATNRDWSEAIDKRAEEGCCRTCRRVGGITVDGELLALECAHLAGRKYDPVEVGPRGGEVRVVPREATIPLCNECHGLFDERRLDVISFTTWPEQAYVVSCLGLVRAYERMGGKNG